MAARNPDSSSGRRVRFGHGENLFVPRGVFIFIISGYGENECVCGASDSVRVGSKAMQEPGQIH